MNNQWCFGWFVPFLASPFQCSISQIYGAVIWRRWIGAVIGRSCSNGRRRLMVWGWITPRDRGRCCGSANGCFDGYRRPQDYAGHLWQSFGQELHFPEKFPDFLSMAVFQGHEIFRCTRVQQDCMSNLTRLFSGTSFSTTTHYFSCEIHIFIYHFWNIVPYVFEVQGRGFVEVQNKEVFLRLYAPLLSRKNTVRESRRVTPMLHAQ